jgi:serine/threonine-protein kinase
MPSSSSEFPIRPSRPDGLLFTGATFRYEFIRPLLEHEDYEPTVVAWRKPLKGRAPARRVLLKRVLLPPKGERHQRASEEARLATFLDHPNITHVLGLESHQGEPYMVTEYLEGCFLETAQEAALLQGGKLSPAFAAYAASEVADALHYAHRSLGEGGQPLHLVHRALSPMRIRLGLQGEVKLGDFGVSWSKLAERLTTPPRVLRAEVSYAAPEVVSFQSFDGRADLYSLGMVLLEVLSGQHPLDPGDLNLPPGESPEAARYNARVHAERTTWASVGEMADRIQRFGPEDVERGAQEVPEGLKRILHKALRRNPDDRYTTGAEMRDALRDWLHGQGTPFGRKQAAEELAHLVRERPSPHETRAFPTERGVLLTPEEAALAEEAGSKKKHRREAP